MRLSSMPPLQMPVAVGTAGMSSADACAKAAQGLKGKLVEVLQVYRDCLCEYIVCCCWGGGVWGSVARHKAQPLPLPLLRGLSWDTSHS